jgi:2,4-dienoyl-CoA reductase-like NADH-dependent reductase (Old Yellow Enzyme family)
MPGLLSPAQFGDLKLANRIVMAPLTRSRATADTRVPTPVMAEYYRQRASAGLILTEATIVDPMGAGYAATPGIYGDEQVEGWKPVVEAVHAAGGKIVMQLWHVGRISDPELLGGNLPVAPSAIAASGHVSLLRPMRPYVTPRALEADEIPGIVAAYRRGARNAKRAGFDGVEAHGANGYLLDQFLQDRTNTRTDRYGGPVENRARLLLEVVDALIEVWGPGRVGVHLAPRGDSHDIGDSDKAATFTYVAGALGKRKIAFIFTREKTAEDSLAPRMREIFLRLGGGGFVFNEGFTAETAELAVVNGTADAVAFGKAFISTPDLVTRIKTGAPFAPWDMETFYGGGAKGYTDYPALPVR